jgi:SAM-dependent methyltransferase
MTTQVASDPVVTSDSWLTRASLFQLSSAYWVSQALYVAAKLGVADYLEAGPRSLAELAALTQTDPAALARILRCLVRFDALRQQEDETYVLTDRGDDLRKAAANSIRAWALVQGEEWTWQPWGALLHTVRTGQPAFEHTYGTGRFAYFQQHPQIAAQFDAAMHCATRLDTQAVVDAYDFSGAHQVVDVGGGKGVLLQAILDRCPHVRGVLFDQPEVIERARPSLLESPAAARCELVGGDFFDRVPAGADVYLLANVLHDWDDARGVDILRACRRAMRPGARLLIVEHVLGEGRRPEDVEWVDMHMLVMYRGGRQRSLTDFGAMLRAAGLDVRRLIATDVALCLVEAVALPT